MELNKDIATRDKIIFGKYRPNIYEHSGGIQHFTNMSLATLRLLLDKHFIDPEDCQNLAPSVQQIYNFMLKYPQYKAHGYAVSDKRDDYRVSLEGVIKGKKTDSPEEFQEFRELFKMADEFNPNQMMVWFD